MSATLAVSAVLVGGFFLRRSPIGSSSCRGAKQVVECSTEDYACETSRTERRSSQILRQSRTGRFAATRRPKRVCTSSVLPSARISGARPAERVLYSVHAVVQRCWQMQNGQPLQLVRYAISRRSTMLQSHIAAPQSTAIVIARVYTPPNCCKKLTARRMFARGAIAPLGQSTLGRRHAARTANLQHGATGVPRPSSLCEPRRSLCERRWADDIVYKTCCHISTIADRRGGRLRGTERELGLQEEQRQSSVFSSPMPRPQRGFAGAR